ncbi:response regulator [Microbacterium sp. NPDC091313]
MAIARLTGGPLDGQVIPLDDDTDDSLILPYGEGQVVYHRQGEAEDTGSDDGPTQVAFVYTEETENINPNEDGRLD